MSVAVVFVAAAVSVAVAVVVGQSNKTLCQNWKAKKET